MAWVWWLLDRLIRFLDLLIYAFAAVAAIVTVYLTAKFSLDGEPGLAILVLLVGALVTFVCSTRVFKSG